MNKKTGLALGAIGLALPWLLMIISLNQNPINKTSSSSSSTSIDLTNLKMDPTAISNGDYTSLTGTWENSAGLTIIFDSKGMVSPAKNKISSVAYKDGYARAILTNSSGASDAYRDGAGIWFYPAGVANVVNNSKQDQDSIVIASNISTEDDPYFKVSTATSLTDSGETDSSSSSDSNVKESSGTYTLTASADVKNSPDTSAKTVATYSAGQTINYDQIVTSGKKQWLSYLSTTGERRYVLMED
ncbi:SH3 domain-containing protein [Streptococcus loxodontisalivarius]|uniref:SH3b domain-containing protein n=1 Tax=Streptococcus loxodontisalivarius TaxID=1349415 RepID=A0ABS2PQV6_9STRE|nr:SH3 domain-containing protein [Streptococcus loxodontisalivarius]MBM7642296.1 hypothetical protein [Streptococcus loxodontisalivarius]